MHDQDGLAKIKNGTGVVTLDMLKQRGSISAASLESGNIPIEELQLLGVNLLASADHESQETEYRVLNGLAARSIYTRLKTIRENGADIAAIKKYCADLEEEIRTYTMHAKIEAAKSLKENNIDTKDAQVFDSQVDSYVRNQLGYLRTMQEGLSGSGKEFMLARIDDGISATTTEGFKVALQSKYDEYKDWIAIKNSMNEVTKWLYRRPAK